MRQIKTDIAIIGAGASGMMAAHFCSEYGKSVTVLDHNKQIGRKILISGGGKCNFTNLYGESKDYYCENSHFVKSAMSRFTGLDFLKMIEDHNVEYEERRFGQLFCKKSAKDINSMLLSQVQKDNVEILLQQKDLKVTRLEDENFKIENEEIRVIAKKLVIATGGLVLPSIGASDFGHRLAKEIGHKIIPTVPALVPFVLEGFQSLSGNAFEAGITVNGHYNEEPVLFTHKGLSGPCILKTSLFWNHNDVITVNWLPKITLEEILSKMKGKFLVIKSLRHYLPNNFVDILFDRIGLDKKVTLGGLTKIDKVKLEIELHKMKLTPSGTEGFRKAETTRGGIDTSKISSKNLESKLQPGVHFIGEVLDVAGQLGGHNFQWAWASANAVGESIR
jgi:hypothetical protein